MSSSADRDVVVVGAGAAGVGAGRALAAAGCRFVILEARARVGGRAWTIGAGHGIAVDLGCEWLHSATVNPLVPLARTAGVVVDEYDKYWAEESDKAKLGEQAYAEFRGTVDGLFAEAEALAAAGGPDAALGDLLPANHRWRPAIEAICSWSSGARLDQNSDVALGRPADSRVNWRLPDGSGAPLHAPARAEGRRVGNQAGTTG